MDMTSRKRLNPSLLLADTGHAISDNAFRATINAHGLYNTQQFVLRLSPRIHRLLSSRLSGVTTSKSVSLELAQAMSTYLHETVHWWQHIGSTYGLLFTLNYPVQAHANYNHLRELVEQDGFRKSILLRSIELITGKLATIHTPGANANATVNNHFDLLAFRAFTLGPEAAKAVIKRDLFKSVGHAFHMTYGNTLSVLSSTVDPEFSTIPHPREWADGFQSLTDRKAEGYHDGSPVGIWPLGSLEIFEGHARFAQIQYLSFGCGHRLNWDDFSEAGMLNGVYVKAFNQFLKLTESDWPSHVDDPLIGLFLLVCDLAINPGRGFPFSIDPDYQTFISDVNPGARFCRFCRLIALKHPSMKRAITKYSREEYEEFSTRLSLEAKQFPTMLVAKTFAEWFEKSGPLAGLRNEFEKYEFKPLNYVVRHLFAHFLSFQQAKWRTPEFFCWPGAWMAGDRVSATTMQLFEQQSALFVDKEEDDGVFPRLQSNREESVVHEVFGTFYQNAVIYDLVNQWIVEKGPFRYEMSWLSTSSSPERATEYMRSSFRAAFGLDTESVEVVFGDEPN
jgi:hypothetical protein